MHRGAPLATFETGMSADVGLHCHQCARCQVMPLAKAIASLDAGLNGQETVVKSMMHDHIATTLQDLLKQFATVP